MGLITQTITFSQGLIPSSSDWQNQFDTVYNLVNGQLDSANIDLTDAYAWTGNNSFAGTSTFTGAVTTGVDDTGVDVKFFGATSGSSFLWDESADQLVLTASTYRQTAGNMYLGDSSNANVTQGLTLNQGAADDTIFCGKSSDVSTGLTSVTQRAVEVDDYFSIGKSSSAGGGVVFQSLMEAGAGTPLIFNVYGGSPSTTKTTAGTALVTFNVRDHDGANALANIDADGNIFAIRAYVGGSDVTRLLVDEDGDLYSVTAAQTFDTEDDEALVDSYDAVRSGYRKWAKSEEANLIRLGILGGPVDEGGMTNVTQLQRAVVGTLRQISGKLAETMNRLQIAESKLNLLEAN